MIKTPQFTGHFALLSKNLKKHSDWEQAPGTLKYYDGCMAPEHVPDAYIACPKEDDARVNAFLTERKVPFSFYPTP